MADPRPIWRGSYALKQIFEKVLRLVFADSTIIQDPRYRYDDDVKKTKIQIVRVNPQRVEMYPTIVISVESHEASLTSVGVESEVTNDAVSGGAYAQSSWGAKIVPVRFAVFAKESSEDRDRLMDLLEQVLRLLARSRFVDAGAWVTISIGGDDQEEDQDGKSIFKNSITIQVNTDFYSVFSPPDIVLINRIVLDVLGKEFPSSTPIPLHLEEPFPP